MKKVVHINSIKDKAWRRGVWTGLFLGTLVGIILGMALAINLS